MKLTMEDEEACRQRGMEDMTEVFRAAQSSEINDQIGGLLIRIPVQKETLPWLHLGYNNTLQNFFSS